MTADGAYPGKVLAWLQPEQEQPPSRRFLPLWLTLMEELSPIVGDSGFAALFARCCHKCGSRFPWLTPQAGSALATVGFGALTAALAARLDSQPAQAGLAASRALFASFYDLLLVLIGERFTAGVLDAAWSRLDPGGSIARLPT